jgi:membrane protease YdiL (CAAX protease family)
LEIARLARPLELHAQALAEEPLGVEPGQSVEDGGPVRARDFLGQAAHPGDLLPEELLQQVGAAADERAEVFTGHAQHAALGAGAHRGRAGVTVESGHLPEDRSGVDGADHDRLPFRPVAHDVEQPLHEDDHLVAGVALPPQQRVARHLRLLADALELLEGLGELRHHSSGGSPRLRPPGTAGQRSGLRMRLKSTAGAAESADVSDEAGAAAPLDDPLAAELRGFGPLGILSILVILAGNSVFHPLSAVLALAWAHRSRTPWREIGYVRPRSWPRSLAIGLVFGIAFKFLMKAIVMPLLGAAPINQAYHYLAGNRAAIPGALFALVIGAGFGEETLFRGYMFERLGKLLGSGVGARIAIVLITSALFGLGHYSGQGFPGAEQATIVGLAFGTIFAVTGRIAMLMSAHASFDLASYLIIYWDLESRVAHLVFK